MSELSSPETATRVLDYLRHHPTVGLRQLGEEIGVGQSTAHRAVARLVRDGSVEVVRRGTGNDYPTTYRVVTA